MQTAVVRPGRRLSVPAWSAPYYARGGGTSGAGPGLCAIEAGCRKPAPAGVRGASIDRAAVRFPVEVQDPMAMQAAPCESAHDLSKGALVVTETAKADEDFGVSGIVIELCLIADPTPPILPEADAQSTPPAATTLVCSRRRETITPASLRGRRISEYLIHWKEKTLVDAASRMLSRTRREHSPVLHGSLIRVPPTATPVTSRSALPAGRLGGTVSGRLSSPISRYKRRVR